jgi:hypothetical protein
MIHLIVHSSSPSATGPGCGNLREGAMLGQKVEVGKYGRWGSEGVHWGDPVYMWISQDTQW